MNKQTRAMKQALEALEKVAREMLAVRDELAERGARPVGNVFHQRLWDSSFDAYTNHALPAAQALRTAIEAAEKQEPAPANLWLYWKVDDKSVVTGPFKTHSKDEAYGLDCIDQTPLTVAAPQPAQQQEPVAWIVEFDDGHIETTTRPVSDWKRGMWESAGKRFTVKPLYTSPPASKPWVPLTDEEIDALREKHSEGRGAGWRFNFKGFTRAIEAAHGIKEQP